MNNFMSNSKSGERKAQSFIEYALYIAMVVAAFAAMFYFFRAYTAGRIRSNVDSIGGGEQYQPS